MDYLSPTLYLIDLVFLGLWVVKTKKERRFDVKKWCWLLVLLISGWVVAESKWLLIYSLIRIWQVAWLVTYVRNNRIQARKSLVKTIPWWIGGQSILGLAQVMKGGSIQGLFYWLGERRFNYTTIGTALFSLDGQGLVRGYGTFSHPNSLAGFLLVAMVLWVSWKKEVKAVGWWIVWWMGTVGVLIAASRMIWVLTIFFGGWGLVKLIKGKKDRWLFGVLSLVLVVGVIFQINNNYVKESWLGGWDKDSLSKRVELNKSAWKMIGDNPLAGVGLGNFLVELPKYQEKLWLQPVHNLGLLALSQTGVVGVLLSVWGWWNIRTKKKRMTVQMVALGVIGVSGMVDHYWLTLPQNYWLLGIVLGLV